MTPRLELFSALRIRDGSSRTRYLRALTTTPSFNASTMAQKRRHQDPYALAQARARKAANISRQETLRTERAKALGDPVRGLTTPFVQSFDTGVPPPSSSPPDGERAEPEIDHQTQEQQIKTQEREDGKLNYFLSHKELQHSLQHSRYLTEPLPSQVSGLTPGSSDPLYQQNREETHQSGHERAQEALRRITSLEIGNSKDRTHVNIQRCISTFGRHKTDTFLSQRPNAKNAVETGHAARDTTLEPNEDPKTDIDAAVDKIISGGTKTPRAGPDTGSSEVQIAILTAKIRTLANFLDTRGRKDKVNKRNLRLLVHKRQKLLRYLRRKERGGERWQYLVKTLGLTQGTWDGEISM